MRFKVRTFEFDFVGCVQATKENRARDGILRFKVRTFEFDFVGCVQATKENRARNGKFWKKNYVSLSVTRNLRIELSHNVARGK